MADKESKKRELSISQASQLIDQLKAQGSGTGGRR